MRTDDFDYYLPPERIAQTPVEPRHASRLLVLKRASNQLEHSTFWDLPGYLRPGDLLVINQTRVLPARIFARKPTGGRVEVLLLRREDALTWEALIGGKHVKPGTTLSIEGGPSVEVVDVLEGSRRRVRFTEPVEPTWKKLARCRCLHTSTPGWRILNATRQFTPVNLVRLLRQPLACILHRS